MKGSHWPPARAGSFAASLALVLALACPAWAGGGPESVFLVVNGRSWASVTVANHFAKLRQIPSSNVLHLDWPYPNDKVDVQVIRQVLFAQTFNAMQQRGITDQIDYIVYSSDFPWAVDFKSELGGQELPKTLAPTASLTGMTYAAPQVQARDYNFIGPAGNHYMRRATPSKREVNSLGFRSWYGYDSEGRVVEAGGNHYILSTMLAVTSGRGNSVDEAIRYLKRSATADGTKPKGTFYYAQNSDIRSTVRDKAFPSAVAALKALGVKGEIVAGTLPQGKDDVLGVVTGTRVYNWAASKSTLLPGAICDNFTSFGGVFTEADQTPLSDFLRYGAAGASGTVVEPFALAEKFPSAFLPVHYARGCTLAESFYQAVHSPYQLLVVGDPLCRPWANIPKITVDGLTPGTPIRGVLTLVPHGTVAGGGTVERFEMFVEGTRLAGCAAGETLELDTLKLPDGDLELRIVGMEGGPIESQGRAIIPIRVSNSGRAIDLALSAKGSVRWGQPLKLSGHSAGANKIAFLNGSRIIGSVEGEEGNIEIKPEELGLGPVLLRAVATLGSKESESVFSAPVELNVEPSKPLAGRKLRDGMKLLPGLQLLPEGGKRVIVPRTNDHQWLDAAGVKPEQPFVMASIFEVPADAVYQFEVKFVGPFSLKVDGGLVFEGNQNSPEWRYAPVSLGAGRHQFELRGVGGQPNGMEIRFGGPGATHLDGKQFQHPG